MTLYEITGEILELQEMLTEGADEQAVKDTLEAVMADFEDKADAYGAVIRNMESDVDSLDAEIKRLQARKKITENGIARVKTRLLNAMETANRKSIEGKVFKFSTKNGAEYLPKDIKLADLPENIRTVYSRVKEPELDKTKLLADVKAGLVKGIKLERSKSLIMK